MNVEQNSDLFRREPVGTYKYCTTTINNIKI